MVGPRGMAAVGSVPLAAYRWAGHVSGRQTDVGMGRSEQISRTSARHASRRSPSVPSGASERFSFVNNVREDGS